MEKLMKNFLIAFFVFTAAVLFFEIRENEAVSSPPAPSYYGGGYYGYNDEDVSMPIMYYTIDRETIEFPLKAYKADVDIVGNIASVKLTQTFVNTSKEKIDAIYRFPGSTQAAVHGMMMKIKDRIIYAQIQEKQEAKETFEKAKSEGKRASLLSQVKPNIFTTEVANIYPGDTIQVVVEYSEIIQYKDYVYSFVLPTKIGKRYQNVFEEVGERGEYKLYENMYANKKIDFDINVSISSIFDIAKASCKSHNVITEKKDGKTIIRLNEETELDRDFILNYEMESQKVETGLIIHEGEEENFFLLMLQAPRRVPAEEILPREYVFVVDVSGSMNGKPIQTAIELYGNLLEGTNETDMFNVIKFAGSNEVLADKSMPATKDNLQEGFDFLSNERGGGGTELLPALKRAMDLPKTDGYSRSVILITDGFITADLEVIEYVSQNLDKGNIFPFGIGTSVNRYIIEGLANISMSEPFIITDMDEALSEAKKFKEYIDSPLMTDIKIEFENFEAYDLVPEKIPDVFAQRPIIISGKYKGHPSGIVRVSGSNGKQEMKTYFQVERFAELDTTKVLKYLWARRKLQTIQDFPGENSYNNRDRNKEEIINLGLKYHLMTNHTSFVAVDAEIPEEANANKDIDEVDIEDFVSTGNSSEDVVYELGREKLQEFACMDVMSSAAAPGVNLREVLGCAYNVDFESKMYNEGAYPDSLFIVRNSVSDKPNTMNDTSRKLIRQPNYDIETEILKDRNSIVKRLTDEFGKYTFVESIYNMEIVIDENNQFYAIKIAKDKFINAKNLSNLVDDLIRTIAKELKDTKPNTIYPLTFKIEPSGKFQFFGKNYQTYQHGNLWKENTDNMKLIPERENYTLYFEIWDEEGRQLAKGAIDNVMNQTNPFIKNADGKVEIPKDEFCMHYISFNSELNLGKTTLNKYIKYFIRLKGVVGKTK